MLQRLRQRFFVRRMIEAPAQRSGYPTLCDALERGAGVIEKRFKKLESSEATRNMLRQAVARERWVQKRLRVALGRQTFVQDDEEYMYLPPKTSSLTELRAAFLEARRDTLKLGHRLQMTSKPVSVPHQRFGLFSPRAWLRYLDVEAHAALKKLR